MGDSPDMKQRAQTRPMSRIALISILPLVSACQFIGLPVAQVGDLRQPDCYTVDIYADAFGSDRIEAPEAGAPAVAETLSGTWGQGAWDGGQCHEIHVARVYEDGSAVVIDTHAPYGDLRATGFRRDAEITEDGRILFDGDGDQRAYVLQGSELHGWRANPNGTVSRVILTRVE
ncbi:MAG: hypothetical protein ACPGID_10360 [Rubricella sp.]